MSRLSDLRERREWLSNQSNGSLGEWEEANDKYIKALEARVEEVEKQNAELARGTQALVAQLGVAQRRVEELEESVQRALNVIREA